MIIIGTSDHQDVCDIFKKYGLYDDLIHYIIIPYLQTDASEQIENHLLTSAELNVKLAYISENKYLCQCNRYHTICYKHNIIDHYSMIRHLKELVFN